MTAHTRDCDCDCRSRRTDNDNGNGQGKDAYVWPNWPNAESVTTSNIRKTATRIWMCIFQGMAFWLKWQLLRVIKHSLV